MYLDYRLRTDNSTHSAAGTIAVVCLRGEVAVFVGLLGDNDAILRAYYHTQAATLAPFGTNSYFTGHFFVLRFTAEFAETIHL